MVCSDQLHVSTGLKTSFAHIYSYFVDPNSHDNGDYYQSGYDVILEYCPKHCLTIAMDRLIANSHSYWCFLARAAEWKTARNCPAVSHGAFWPEHTNSFSTFLEQQFVWQHQKVKITRINHFQRELAKRCQQSESSMAPRRENQQFNFKSTSPQLFCFGKLLPSWSSPGLVVVR